MGKAIVIGVTLILLVMILGFFLAWFNRKPAQGDMNRKQEFEAMRLLNGAAGVMRSLGNAHNNVIEDTDFLSDRSQGNVDRWLKQYDTFNLKKREIGA